MSLSVIFSDADKPGSSEMLTNCQILYIHINLHEPGRRGEQKKHDQGLNCLPLGCRLHKVGGKTIGLNAQSEVLSRRLLRRSWVK